MSIKAPSEGDVVKQVLAWLRLCGVMCWRNSTGAFRVPRGGKDRLYRFGAVGSPDVVGIVSRAYSASLRGMFIGVEVKMSGRKLTAAQQAFLQEITDSGGLAVVVTSLAELQTFLESRGIRP